MQGGNNTIGQYAKTLRNTGGGAIMHLAGVWEHARGCSRRKMIKFLSCVERKGVLGVIALHQHGVTAISDFQLHASQLLLDRKGNRFGAFIETGLPAAGLLLHVEAAAVRDSATLAERCGQENLRLLI
jgi:hypothetical protein